MESNFQDKLGLLLTHSNIMEKEYSKKALIDAMKAWNYAVDNFREEGLTPEYMMGGHRILMKNIAPKIAGKIRDDSIHLINKDTGEVEDIGIEPEKILVALEELCDPKIYPYSTEEQIKRWHIRSLKIHPFEDGNGRLTRIIMNTQRVYAELPLLIIHPGKEQMEYYKWFKSSMPNK